MRAPSLAIGDIARSVGYDPFMFSKAFKKVKGVSPREYRSRSL
jgi:YesN/AraC family two-component response regulator